VLVAGIMVVSFTVFGDSWLAAVVSWAVIGVFGFLGSRLENEYVEDEITLEEFEHEAELALDGKAVEIRGVVETIDGIGEEISASIALEFDTIDDLEDASKDELMQVYGVGEQRAVDIIDEVQ